MKIRFGVNSYAIAGSLALLMAAPIANAEQLISAQEPEVILEVAKGFGSANLDKDSSGDPRITGRIEGVKYGITFYGCNSGKECDDVVFVAAWSDTDVSLNDVNGWNLKKKFGKAYIDKDGDPRLEMAVNLEYGVSKENFEDTFDWWSTALKEFKQTVL